MDLLNQYEFKKKRTYIRTVFEATENQSFKSFVLVKHKTKIKSMKTLIIMRHGKAEQMEYGLDDYDRQLTDRGRRNSMDMGKYIAAKFGTPEMILSSSARRTEETAKQAAMGINFPSEKIIFDEALYLTSASRIIRTLAKTDNLIASCLLIGHNPGLTDLVNQFGVNLDNLPTSSAVCFSFFTDFWGEISRSNARYEWIQLARTL